jgi:hypothetical protein
MDSVFWSSFGRSLFVVDKAGSAGMNLKSLIGKGRKGELTTKQLVTIIVLIVSFIIILFLIFRLNLGETTNKEICHNSVLLKNQNKLTSGPLDCRTNYLCISEGADCGGTQTSKVEAKTRNETLKALAEEMSDCWWQFGEGKIDYASGGAFGNAACSICSIVKFDGRAQTENPISYEEFYGYLRTTQKEGAQSYLQYLYSTNALESIREEFYIEGYLNGNLDLEKSYFILTGMKNSIVWGLFGSNHIPVTIMEVSSENYDKIGCDEFLTKA